MTICSGLYLKKAYNIGSTFPYLGNPRACLSYLITNALYYVKSVDYLILYKEAFFFINN